MKIHPNIWLLLLLLLLPAGCNRPEDGRGSSDTGRSGRTRPSFLQIGEFTVTRKSDTLTLVRDGAGRTLALVPRGTPPPEGFAPAMVVRTPVQRVVAYGFFDVATLRVLGVLDQVLVGVTTPREKWYVDDVRRGVESGRIRYLGTPAAIDYEQLRAQAPELVLTWDPSIIPMLDEMGIPCVITTTPVAMCLNARMSFVRFLAPFFGRQQEAERFFHRVSASLADIRARTAASLQHPRVMWGDMYEKRVLVEPGNAWIGELVALVNGGYLFEDVYGTSCIEISQERFLYSGRQADIYFTYRTEKSGATSKAALARINPLMAGIRPLGPEGRVYIPRPWYSQSGDRLDAIFTEIAAILHPDVYPGYRLRFFKELPATDLREKKEK